MSMRAASMFVGELVVRPVVAFVEAGRAPLAIVSDEEEATVKVRACAHGMATRQACECCDLDDWLFNRDERF
jgi:hypothetical protein